jgi:GNAT superfamily N-acetyltransferase
MLKVRIRPARMAEASAVLAIADKEFGSKYLSEPDLSGSSGFEVFVALYSREVVGFGIIEKVGSVSGQLHDVAELPMDIQLAEKNNALGIIKTVAVLEELQGHGIGAQLFIAMEKILRRNGKSLIAVPAWQDDNGVHISGILSGNGYCSFLTCNHYWKDECDKGLFTCKCRQNRDQCICNLIWYKKAVVPIPVLL